MNVVDYVIIGILGVSLLFGLYRGFVSTVLNTGGALLSFGASFLAYPRLAELIQSNEDTLRTLIHYTDASSRIGDLEMSLRKVADLSAEGIDQVVQKANLPQALSKLLENSLTNQVWASSGLTTVSDYVTQSILTAVINILCFMICFAAIYLVLSILINLLRAVFHFPVLKQLDTLAGGAFGLLRGGLICYVLFLLVPLVMTVIPVDFLQELLDQSALAGMFNNGTLLLSVMNGRL